MEEEDDEDVEKTKCQICIKYTKKVLAFILSHVGLITLVVSYCLVGAAMFEALESDHEKEVKAAMVKVRQSVSQDLWTMTRETEIIHPDRWAANASRRLQQFETELLKAMRKKGWDGSEDPEQLQWTFTGSLFYSIITITTIGYGHIAPKTVWGKIVTIFYAIIGIPLMVLCWSHLGDFMAESFRFLYWRVCCYMCTRQPKKRRGAMRRGRSTRRGGPGPKGSIRHKRSIRRSVRTSTRSADSIPGSMMSASSDPNLVIRMRREEVERTLHKGSRARATHPYRVAHPQYQRPNRITKSAEPELRPNLPVLYNKYADEMIQIAGVVDEQPGSTTSIDHAEKPQFSRNRSVPPNMDRYDAEYFWYEDEDEYGSEYDEADMKKRPVPIWLCSGLVLGYIIGGAFLFSSWESWAFLDSAYFCFITLSTIGFGDFVPTQEDERAIALCSLYLIFGIALLAMSFNLVQEQVINAVKKVAMTIGILDDEEDE